MMLETALLGPKSTLDAVFAGCHVRSLVRVKKVVGGSG
jgi:hypothetical protein